MRFIFACRVVSYSQIIRRYFPKTHEVVARRRIRSLAKCGYLKISVIELFGKTVHIVQPLPAIWPLIREKWSLEVDRPHFKSESLEHDVRMTELFMQLEKLACFRSFFTENLLQSATALAEDPRFGDIAKNQSDGALSIQDANGNFRIYAVEFEVTKKSPDSYRQKFIDYYLARGIDGVLYISPLREIHSLLARTDEEIGKDREPLVWWGFEKNALSDLEKVTFYNRKEQCLELR